MLYAKENIYVVKTLKEFQHVDDAGKDVGFNGKFTRINTIRIFTITFFSFICK